MPCLVKQKEITEKKPIPNEDNELVTLKDGQQIDESMNGENTLLENCVKLFALKKGIPFSTKTIKLKV